MGRKIRNIITYKANMLSAGKPVAEPQFHKYKVAVLNSSGKTALEVEFLPNGTHRYSAKYIYDAEGRLTKKRVHFISERSMEETHYRYNQEGKVTEEIFYHNKRLYDRIVFQFDSEGREIVKIHIDKDNNLVAKEEFAYHESGPLKEQKVFGADERLDSYRFYEINEAGLVTKELSAYMKDGELVKNETLYIYDEEGRKIRSEVKDEAGELLGFVTISYNDAGKPLRYYSEAAGIASSRMINQMTYDEQGRVVSSEYFDMVSGKVISKETLSYDEEGNIKEEERLETDADTGEVSRHTIVQIFYDYADEAVKEGRG